MSKCLFFNIPAFGHVNPTIPLVKELTERGVEVIYYNTKGFQDTIEKQGVPVRTYPGVDFTTTGPEKINQMKLMMKLLSSSESMTDFAADEIKKEKPDFVITDNLAFWGKIAAESSGTPLVTSNTTIAFNPSIQKKAFSKFNIFKMIPKIIPFFIGMRKVKKVFRKYNIPPEQLRDYMFKKSALNLVFTSRMFQPEDETFGDEYKFIGPSIDTPYVEQERDTIYISMGTIFNKNTRFIEQCFEAFEDLPYRVVISLGKGMKNPRFDRVIPGNVIVRDFVNQKEMLQRSVLFVTHGGMNGTSEGLYFETPLLVLPQMGEQKLNGQTAEELGAAILMDPKKITASKLKENALKIINDPSFYENASKVRESFVEAGGYKKGADEIIQAFCSGKKKVNAAV